MKNSTTTTFASLCSLSIGLWGYQTGVWPLAIPMVLALEARFLMKRRWKISLDHYQVLFVVAAFLWLLSIFYIPSASPVSIPYATSHHILKCLPIGLFPLVLAQTYFVNCTSLNQQLFGAFFGFNKSINLYYPYFGICLLAASVTGGNTMLFLGVTAVLVAGFLGTLRSQRFSPALFYGLIGLALILCLMGTHEFQRLQASIKLKAPDIGEVIENIASSLAQEQKQPSKATDPKDPSLKIDPALQAEALKTLESLLKGGKPTGSQANEMAQPANPSPASSVASPSPSSSPTAIPSTGSTDNISPSQTSSSPSNQTSSSPSPVSATPSSENSPPLPAENGSSQSAVKPFESSSSSSTASPSVGTIGSSQTSSPPSGIPGSPTTVASTQGVPPSAQGNQNTNNTNQHNTNQHNTNQPSGNLNGTGTSLSNAGAGNAQSGSRMIQAARGTADPQKSSTQIGQSGSLQMSDAIVFRVVPTSGQNSNGLEPNFPLYIREAAYNQYSQGTWNAASPRFIAKNSTSNKRHWMFGSRTPNTASIRILANLTQREGPLRLPVGTSDIDNLAMDSIQTNQYGTVLAQGNPGDVAYTVQFDPTQSLDSPPTQQDLEIPQAEQATMQKILKSLNLQRTSDQAILQAIAAFFDNGFQYTLDLPQPQQNTTPLSAFLLDHRSGHCEYFASATSLLLRAAGIPTRYTVGYYVHEYSSAEQQYIVRAKHAHAWVMAYANGSWISLDTTPGGGSTQGGNFGTMSGSGLSQGSNTGNIQAGGLSQGGKVGKIQEGGIFKGDKIQGGKVQESKVQGGKAGKTPKGKVSPFKSHPQKDKTKPEPSPAVNEKGKTTLDKKVDPVQAVKSFFKKVSEEWARLLPLLSKRTDTLAWVGVILVLGFMLIFLSVFFVWRAIAHKFFPRRNLGQRRNVAKLSDLPLMDGLDSEFYLIEKRLGEWGLERKPSETIRQWIVRLKQKLPAAKMNSLHEIIDLHYRYRFDPEGIIQDDRTRLRSMIQSWLRETRTQRS